MYKNGPPCYIKETTTVYGCMQKFICYFFLFHTLIINRHEKWAETSVLFPVPFLHLFFFYFPHCKEFFIEFTTKFKKKTKITGAWHKLNILLPADELSARPLYDTHMSELCSSSKSQETKKIYIYIYIFISYSQLSYLHVLGSQSKWAENEDVSTRNNLSKREVEAFPVHSGPFK